MPLLQGSLPCRSYRRPPWRSSQPRCRPSRCRAPRSRRRRRHGHRPLRLRARRKRPLPTEGATTGDTVGGAPAYTIGNAVSVVTGEELRAQQVRNAAEALRSLPGVAVSRSGGVGNLTQVRIRGAEGNHTLVLIDGIEANNTADGEFDFSNLVGRGHRAHRGDPRAHERPLRLQRRRRRHQHHHPHGEGPSEP